MKVGLPPRISKQFFKYKILIVLRPRVTDKFILHHGISCLIRENVSSMVSGAKLIEVC